MVLTRDFSLLNQLLELLPQPSSAAASLKRAQDKKSRWLTLATRLNWEDLKKIDKLNLSGLSSEAVPVRVYPEGSSSAHLLGFVGKNDSGQPQGYFGLEGFYNRELSGRPGLLFQERDAFNRPILLRSENKIFAQPGRDLSTSIDRTVQFIIHNRLLTGLSKYQASAGTVLVMDPNSGRVLGMTALPNYDPLEYYSFPSHLYRNPLTSESYEPGSTFKTIVMSSALDARAVTPETECTICTGPVNIGDMAVRSWNDKYYPKSSMTDVILHSDNVGMVFVGRKLGKTKLLDYIRRFGFGAPTGIDLEGEIAPPLRDDNRWAEIDLATISFGQGIAVTPLQMVTAVSAIANGGKLTAPRVVTSIGDAKNPKNVPQTKPIQVISRLTASQITQMMINGVNRGEVRYYKPQGYLIAGKTGTAQVPIEGHYDKEKTIASFIGFAPADDPKFAMLVTLNDPQTSPWGSTTAAPLWFDIARDLFRYFGLGPSRE
ncbi:hypothetical protein A2989_02560 [Candidatus Amesbacteria bacterium RIFCSPLOWO2_01_FULL_48_25]|uniref:Penicillin-binding protein transpeptidase domain-containing protein n=1 Tax=Candidatus Amesbacteria bacterium RIFCSPLOWO2_01_FULL_48_25 TaxID=1797259 RepID=A0A1F4ZC57_9BACT|nr:MAG: hypothetical protein A2989_02560 [Candidatus Amesbacteria bacterium RIFCSPLOWO2_01_FULL_48_25]